MVDCLVYDDTGLASAVTFTFPRAGDVCNDAVDDEDEVNDVTDGVDMGDVRSASLSARKNSRKSSR